MMCVSQTNHKDKIVKLRCKANGRVFKTNNQIFLRFSSLFVVLSLITSLVFIHFFIY
ncbi:unnamed protein product [Brassica rapa]|uniref:Transmembrane protein n=2 Tax=Brassica TaxID=3705 RepID=A0A3P5YYI9_BRACM|nr:unnamed protein product [Brassica napus]CAG7869278.1 unnamed protein product [Brassica rapa]CDY26164.1 BnaA06g12530D [Brassica napus]VDC66030.1 unnamed protein product [Brassica rapa]